MEINSVVNQEQGDAWLKKNSAGPSFLQSWAWGEILRAEGKPVERLAIIDNGQTVAQAQVVYERIPGLGWQYAFCPAGPAAANESGVMNYGWKSLADYLRGTGCIFLRWEPSFLIYNSKPVPSKIAGFTIQKTIDVTPRATTILDLSKSEGELLSAMHEKTRYNIRLAERKGISVTPEKNFAEFRRLLQGTSERDAFRPHPARHYQNILASELSVQFNALADNKIIAALIGVRFGNTFTYLFGASDYAHRSLMAPYLLQWEAIKFAKQWRYRYYDFFGIAPGQPASPSAGQPSARFRHEYDLNHQYAGVTRFKLGFGGSIQEAPGTYDLIISPGKYKMYQLLRSIRRLV